jgi:hypothetical protein
MIALVIAFQVFFKAVILPQLKIYFPESSFNNLKDFQAILQRLLEQLKEMVGQPTSGNYTL